MPLCQTPPTNPGATTEAPAGPAGVPPRCPLQRCSLWCRFMASFLRLGSWNVVMFISYEQLQRMAVLARPAQP